MKRNTLFRRHCAPLCRGFLLLGIVGTVAAVGIPQSLGGGKPVPGPLKSTEGWERPPLLYGRVNVILVMLPDCPIARKSMPEVNRVYAEFGHRATFSIVMSDPDLSPQDAAAWKKDFSFPGTVLLDPKLFTARAFGATHTPTALVFDAKGNLRYRGRIDDRYPELGRARPAAQNRDLRDILAAVMANRAANLKTTPVTGCLLPLEIP